MRARGRRQDQRRLHIARARDGDPHPQDSRKGRVEAAALFHPRLDVVHSLFELVPIELLGELSELAKAVEEELTRAQRAAEADAGA